MWDVMNEPLITSWVRQDAPDREQRVHSIWAFVHHFCEVMKRIAGPMVGGLVSSTLLTLIVLPALYLLWKKLELRRRLASAEVPSR